MNCRKNVMKENILNLYADYLLSSFSYTIATGLSVMPGGKISHDKVSKFLNRELLTGKDLWKKVKPTIRSIESQNGVVIIDDTIEEKPYTVKMISCTGIMTIQKEEA